MSSVQRWGRRKASHVPTVVAGDKCLERGTLEKRIARAYAYRKRASFQYWE